MTIVRASFLSFILASVSVLPVKASPLPFNKVLVIVLENASYSQASSQPFLSRLMKRGAALTDYHAVTHPSQPNYIAMIAGDTMGVRGDQPVDLDGRHLGDLLEAKGLSWAVYAEGYPGGCFTGSRKGHYARKHVPFLSFTNVTGDPARCARVKNSSAFVEDAAAGLPAFSFYIPDLDDDGHDTGVAVADKWLASFLTSRLDDPAFMKGLLVVVTFDENDGSKGNRILTLLLGDGVKPGSTSGTRYDHASLLRTVEKAFDLGDLGRGDARAAVFDGIWEGR